MSTDDQYYADDGVAPEEGGDAGVAGDSTPYVFKHRETTFFPPVRDQPPLSSAVETVLATNIVVYLGSGQEDHVSRPRSRKNQKRVSLSARFVKY